MRIAIILGCLSATLFTACGGGQTAAQKSAEFKAAAGKFGPVVRLQLSDLPAGWSEKPAEEDTPFDKAFTDALMECFRGPFSDKALEPVHTIDAKNFKGPADQQLTIGPRVFSTIDAAQGALDVLAGSYSKCGSNLTNFARTIFGDVAEIGGSPEAVDLSVTYADRNTSNLGDASRGFRLTIDERVSHSVRYTEFQFVRVGHFVAGVMTTVNEAQQEQLETLPKIVESKLRAAEATLPK